jgi:hypothetical protein
LFFSHVHGFLIGRSEYIDRSAFGHLLQQRAGGAEVQCNLGLRILRCVVVRDFLERIGQARGSGNREVGGKGGAGCGDQGCGCQQPLQKRGLHSYSPVMLR